MKKGSLFRLQKSLAGNFLCSLFYQKHSKTNIALGLKYFDIYFDLAKVKPQASDLCQVKIGNTENFHFPDPEPLCKLKSFPFITFISKGTYRPGRQANN